MFLLAVSTVLAADVVLRNDVSDTYDTGDQLAWLEFPECAIAVLEAKASQLPLDIRYVEVMFASNTGNQDGEQTLAEVGIQILAEGEKPTATAMDWGPEGFTITVSSTGINRLALDDEDAGWSALAYTSGSIAVWVCTPDPATGEAWPRVNDRDESGIVIDTSAPAAGSYLYMSGAVKSLGSLGVNGAWVIHAGSGEGGGTDTGSDTGGPAPDTGGEDTDSGEEEGLLAVASVTPNTGAAGEAVSIAILGEGFEANAQVHVGGLAASAVSLSGTTALTATTPTALPVGTHDILVTNPGGDSATLAGAFTVEAAGCGCNSGAATVGGWVIAAILVKRRRI